MDYDAIVIGSGFGGAITGCRLQEAGARVLVLERGRWWDKKTSPGRTEYPRSPGDPWLWNRTCPERENGWIDFRVFRDMTVVQGAAVGGGSLIYANISCEAPEETFQSGWPAEITYRELKPYYDRVKEFMNVQRVPANQWTERMKLMQRAAGAIGEPARFQQLELAVSFDKEWHYGLEDCHNVERHSKRFRNTQGVEQGTCVHLGNCDIGCDADAKNTLDRNYIPRGIEKGMEVRPLHLVSRIQPEGSGYRVHYDRLHDGARVTGSQTADMVIVAAGSMGSTELLLRCRDEYRTLPALSPRLGWNWSSNGDFLTPAFHNFDVLPTKGPTIACAINFLDGSFQNQRFWVEDGGFPDLAGDWLHKQAQSAASVRHLRTKLLIEGIQRFLQHEDPVRNVMPWFAQGVDAADGRLRLRKKWWLFGPKVMCMDWDIRRSEPAISAIVEMHEKLAHATGGRPLVSPAWSLAKDLITPHPLGGCNMGNTAADGVVNHAGEVFGYPNLYVADAAIIPEALGVNPSRTIGALAERVAAMIISKKQARRAAG